MALALTIGKFLLGGLGWLKDAISAAFRWCVAHPALTALILALVALWWQTSALQGMRKDLLAMTKARDAEIATHRATKASYRHAQAEAAEQDRLNRERVENEHARLLEHVATKYAADLADARGSFAERLRTSQTRTCVASSGGNEELPVLSRPADGTSGPRSEAIIHVADAGICIDNTVRLERVIEAWKAAAAVEVNGG